MANGRVASYRPDFTYVERGRLIADDGYLMSQPNNRIFWKDSNWVTKPFPFEPVDVLGNVYNRLVIFDASAIHSASQYFGTIKENARLWQMFFFDTE